MKVLFLSLSAALLCTVVFTHHGGEHDYDPSDDHAQHKRGNSDGDRDRDHDQHGKIKHNKHHHDHTNETLAFRKITEANTQFALKLYTQLATAHPSENIFFSPISISIAFAMLCEGAKARTHDQILKGLGFNNSEFTDQERNSGFRDILRILNNPDSELQLSSGNALFIDQRLKMRQSFLDDVSTNYASKAFSTDFEKSDEAKNQINSYVEGKTNGKIVDLISSVSQDSVLMLINFIYFRGKWVKPFDEKFTKEADFHVDENTVVKVPFMWKSGRFYAFLSENVTVVEIPYKGNAAALFILPKDGNCKHIEADLQKSTINEWKSKLTFQSLNLHLPKFSLTKTLNLETQLTKMGITDVFSDNADLSGIAEDIKLKLSKAVHKAAVSVDEKGTEAAAATALEIMPMSLPPTVSFDKPFAFFISSSEIQNILFLGKICNPVAT